MNRVIFFPAAALRCAPAPEKKVGPHLKPVSPLRLAEWETTVWRDAQREKDSDRKPADKPSSRQWLPKKESESFHSVWLLPKVGQGASPPSPISRILRLTL